MFSPSDDIRKFEQSLSVEESLETVRECGSRDFIAPESLKTELESFQSHRIFNALGQILGRIFHAQIIWMNCLEGSSGKGL